MNFLLFVWTILFGYDAQFTCIIVNHYLLFIKCLDSDCLDQKKVKNSKMEEELKCPLCLDFFKAPVRITNCGHNYCQKCLTGMTTIPWLCTECSMEQQQRPEQLTRNFFLEKSVENFVESKKNICATHDLPKKLRKFSNWFWFKMFFLLYRMSSRDLITKVNIDHFRFKKARKHFTMITLGTFQKSFPTRNSPYIFDLR